MRSQPSLGLFFSVAAILAGLFVLVTPVSSRFQDPGGGVTPSAGDPVRCLRLSYSGTDFRWLPTAIRLLPQQRFSIPPAAPWYRTDGYTSSWVWRPAGPDSIDMAGPHGPVLRIPATGAHATGRGGWPYHANILDALASSEWRVDAVAVPCSVLTP